MAPMLTIKRQLLLKKEAETGTAEVLTSAEGGVIISNPKYQLNTKFSERKPAKSSLSALDPIPGQTKCTFTFSIEDKGSGVVGQAPKHGPLFEACGLVETINPGVSVTYKRGLSTPPTLTLAMLIDGKLITMSGAAGTIKSSLKIGDVVYLDMTFDGVFVSEVDQANMDDITYEQVNPVPFMGVNILSFAGYHPAFSSFMFDLGNALQMRDDVNSGGNAAGMGYISSYISSAKGLFSIDPENVPKAAKDFFGDMLAGTPQEIIFTLNGGAGNTVTHTFGRAIITKLDDADRNGLCILGVDGTLAESAVDAADDISIVIT
jgi:hypothetical protein